MKNISSNNLEIIQNQLVRKKESISQLSFNSFLKGVADYFNFICTSDIYPRLKQKIDEDKQRDFKNYSAMKNNEDKPWSLSPSVWLAWEKTGVIYDVIYSNQKYLHLEEQINAIGIRSYIEAALVNHFPLHREREDNTRETFDRVHSFIMEELVNEQLDQNTKNTSDHVVNKDYKYENYELCIQQHNDTPCTLDFSKAPILRPVFETFYHLYIGSGRALFSKQELLDKYKELQGTNIDWKIFINRKSSICGKMINKKTCLKSRIIWGYDKKEKQYRFEILPISDTLSDNQIKNKQ